jgi:hypothetical protein
MIARIGLSRFGRFYLEDAIIRAILPGSFTAMQLDLRGNGTVADSGFISWNWRAIPVEMGSTDLEGKSWKPVRTGSFRP